MVLWASLAASLAAGPPLAAWPGVLRVGAVGGAAAAGGAVGAGLGYAFGTIPQAGFCEASVDACRAQGFVLAGLGATVGAVGGGGAVAWAVGARPTRTVWGAGGSALAGTALGVGLGIVTHDVPLSIAAGVGAIALGSALTVATDRPVSLVPTLAPTGRGTRAGLRLEGRF